MLFVYGTLKNRSLRKEILRKEVTGVPAKLHDYKVNHTRSYPYIEKSVGSIVNGLLLHLDEDQLKLLDRYEHTPDLYIRTRVDVDYLGENINSWVYMVVPERI